MRVVGEEGIEPVDLQIKNLLHYRLCYSPVRDFVGALGIEPSPES
jgi:hypothetical protein